MGFVFLFVFFCWPSVSGEWYGVVKRETKCPLAAFGAISGDVPGFAVVVFLFVEDAMELYFPSERPVAGDVDFQASEKFSPQCVGALTLEVIGIAPFSPVWVVDVDIGDVIFEDAVS